MKTAIVTGATGQDASYLIELLLNKGYKVYGMLRRESTNNSTKRIKHLLDNKNLILLQGDLTDLSSIERIVNQAKPDEFYNLGAQSFVPTSWTNPLMTSDVTGIGVLRCLEAIRRYEECTHKQVRFYQAGSSEQFGKVKQIPQTEDTPFYPRSPYGVAKVFGYEITRNYRESYNMFAVTGICFNHESGRRGDEFVTMKIINYVKNDQLLELGNINSKRDWGYSKDYVEAMWMMLQNSYPQDFIISTGKQHSVKEFVEETYKQEGINICWKGEGVNEVGYYYHKNIPIVKVKINLKYYRPVDVNELVGDNTKIKEILGWKPKTNFKQLIKLMREGK